MDIKIALLALLLGIVEGLTEFIPVSSTGHLILLIDILKFKGPEGRVFEIVIQLGAILAVCWLYRKKLIRVLIGLPKEKEAQKFAFNITLAFLPAAVLGVMFHSFIKEVLFSPTVVSVSLIVGGILILIIEKTAPKPKYDSIEKISFKTALMIGFAQALAMIPGTSRSGATIMGSLLLKVERKTATEFSFFLAIPTMLGATVYDLYKNSDILSFDNLAIIAIGFFAAFFAALLVVRTVINFISTHGFKPFAYYRIVLGTIMLILLHH
ncbi:MAG: undecaprenyl-diphosphatase [Alphaproteobacteria bacterium CG11_big_fil_rev_8_21_14_0_20_39_49]|nr:MAG: undecaprenyl-diphosphatase [Alphaproteobacteria bacterium CG11_big_fil_rev_8_21_14_0_20_39_49]